MTVPESPHSWDAGPPKSEIETWRWQRRCVLLDVATTLLVKGENLLSALAETPEERVDSAVKMAKRLIQRVDEAVPRL